LTNEKHDDFKKYGSAGAQRNPNKWNVHRIILFLLVSSLSSFPCHGCFAIFSAPPAAGSRPASWQWLAMASPTVP